MRANDEEERQMGGTDGFRFIGRPWARVDGPGKVTGETKYADDLVLPRMLYGKLLRSHLPHARIVRLDVSRARAMPGVHAVIDLVEAVSPRPASRRIRVYNTRAHSPRLGRRRHRWVVLQFIVWYSLVIGETLCITAGPRGRTRIRHEGGSLSSHLRLPLGGGGQSGRSMSSGRPSMRSSRSTARAPCDRFFIGSSRRAGSRKPSGSTDRSGRGSRRTRTAASGPWRETRRTVSPSSMSIRRRTATVLSLGCTPLGGPSLLPLGLAYGSSLSRRTLSPLAESAPPTGDLSAKC